MTSSSRLKNLLLVALAVVTTFVIVACQPKQTAKSAGEAGTGGGETGEEETPAVEGAPARVEGQAAAFATAQTLTDDDRAFSLLEGLEIGSLAGSTFTAEATLDLGETLTLTGAKGQAVIGGSRQDLLHVRSDTGREGFVPSAFIAGKAGLATVVAEQAAVYTEADETAKGDAELPAGTLIAASLESMKDPFPVVVAVDPLTKRVFRGVHLRQHDLSFRKDDVSSAILMARAAAAPEPAEALALLRRATTEFPSSAFMVQIEEKIAELGAMAASGAGAQERASEPFFASLITTEDDVAVRSSPDEQAGRVVSTLAKGKGVEVEAKTTEDYTVGDATAPWYRIQEPVGWVFGAQVGVE